MIAPLPDSPLVREATALSARAHTPSLFNHSLRVFVLGREVGRLRGLQVDEEGLLLVALLHDLGLSSAHRNPALAFPEVGADLVRKLVRAHGEPARAQALAEAVAMHVQLFPRGPRSVEGALLHLGNVIDVTGFRSNQVGRSFLAEAQEAFPRLKLNHEGAGAVLASMRSFRSIAGLVVPFDRPAAVSGTT